MRLWGPILVLAAVLSGCAQVQQVNDFGDKASVCTEALGLADLNPLVDPAKLRARAADKERRFRELANNVADRDVKNSLFTLADSYVEVQKEHFDDMSVVATWA